MFKDLNVVKCLFVCLWSSFDPFENFHSFGDITIASEGLQITFAQYQWSLSSERS